MLTGAMSGGPRQIVLEHKIRWQLKLMESSWAHSHVDQLWAVKHQSFFNQ
jgi:hypothetical protein